MRILVVEDSTPILGHASIQTTQRHTRISDELGWRENARLFGKEVAKEE